MERTASEASDSPSDVFFLEKLGTVVSDFLAKLQPKTVTRKTKQKQTIRDFSNFYFLSPPEFSEEDIKLLLYGGRLKGLLQTCGNRSWKTGHQLKKSAEEAIRLLRRLLDTQMNPHALAFIKVIAAEESLPYIHHARLGKHILSEHGTSREDAFMVLHTLRGVHPNAKIVSGVALEKFFVWSSQQEKLESAAPAIPEIVVKGDPQTWTEVEEMDEREEEDANDAEPLMEVVDGDIGNVEDIQDPLGLGRIDRKTVMYSSRDGGKGRGWRKRAGDTSGTTTSGAMLTSKILPSSSEFNPSFYLAQIHRTSRWEELVRGRAKLSEEVRLRNEQMKMLAKENYDRFVNCKDSMDMFHEELRNCDILQQDTGMFFQVKRDFERIGEHATHILQPILSKKEQADKIRNALRVLHRFQQVFNLPSRIREGIAKGEYDKAVRDYKMAKRLIVHSRILILRKVKDDVDGIAENLRTQLFHQLESPHTSPEEAEKIIGYLTELDSSVDPAMHYLRYQHDYILSLMEQAFEEHGSKVAALHSRMQLAKDMEDRTADMQRESPSQLGINLFLSSKGSSATGDSDQIDTEDFFVARLVRRLSSIVAKHVPDFWKFAHSLFLGKHGTRPSSSEADPNPDGDSPARRSGGATPSSTHDRSRLSKVEGQVKEEMTSLLHGYTTWIRSTLCKSVRVAQPFMRDSVMDIRNCYGVLEKADIPAVCLEGVSNLVNEVCRLFVVETFTAALEEIHNLHQEEDWIPDESMRSITSLPGQLHATLSGTLKDLRGVLPKDHSLLQVVRHQFFEAPKPFCDCLHRLAFMDKASLGPDREGTTMPSVEERALLVLGNLTYTHKTILPRLVKEFEGAFPSCDTHLIQQDCQGVTEIYDTLERIVLHRYLAKKTIVFNGLVKRGMFTSGVDWVEGLDTLEIRDHILELLLQFVLVHAEVSQLSETLVRQIISKLLENVAMVFIETVRGIDRFGMNGVVQAEAEALFVEETLRAFKTSASERLFRTLYSTLERDVGAPPDEHRRRLRLVLDQTAVRSRFLFECFRV